MTQAQLDTLKSLQASLDATPSTAEQLAALMRRMVLA